MSEKPISPLRRRMIEDMSVRKFGEKTQHDYIRHIENFAKFLGRSPDTATGEDLRRYQVHQTATGAQPPSVNSSAVALRFLFTVTLGCANLATQLTRVHYPRTTAPMKPATPTKGRHPKPFTQPDSCNADNQAGPSPPSFSGTCLSSALLTNSTESIAAPSWVRNCSIASSIGAGRSPHQSITPLIASSTVRSISSIAISR
jgi:hypothetical protein